MKANKLGNLIIFVLLLSIMVFSCNKKSESNNITVWIPGDEHEYAFYFDMFKNYKQHLAEQGQSFDYVIEQQPWGDYWTKLPLEIRQGRGPDLFLSHVAYAEILVPIARSLSLSDDVLNKFRITNLYVDEDSIPIFIPTVFISKIMYVNTALVSDWQTYPKTWEDFTTVAGRYTNLDKSIVGFNYSFHLLWDIMYQHGQKITNEKGQVFSGATIALNTILEWEKQGLTNYLTFGGSGDTSSSLYEGSAAYVYGEPWMEFWAPDEVKERIKAFPIPGGLTHNSAELSFGINKNTSDEKYTVLNDFVEFMLTDKKTITAIVKGNSGISNNKEIEISYEPFTAGDAVKKTFENNNSHLSVPPRALEQVYKTMLEDVLNGHPVQQSIDDAIVNADGIDVSRLRIMESMF